MRELSPVANRLSLSLDSTRCCRTVASGRDLQKNAVGQKRTVEGLWREFFSDPSEWWDHRWEKVNIRYPDFTHKRTQEALWLNSKLMPPWVETGLAAMAPGVIQPNLFSWNARLAKNMKAGKSEETMKLFQQMQQEDMSPDRFSFIPVLNACASLLALEEGRRVHAQIIHSGWESNLFVANSLINMYAKCGSIEDAWRVFKEMPMRDVFSWNAIILGCVKCGQAQKSLSLYQEMQEAQVDPDTFTFVGVLNACASEGALQEGRCIHEQVIRCCCDSNVFVGSSLVDMYAKCESIVDARSVFNKLPIRNVVTWNAMIWGYVKCGQGEKALELFGQMQKEGLQPLQVTFVGALNACASVGALVEGRRIHEQIIEIGCEADDFVASGLVDMYARCGSIDDALKVFNKMHKRDLVAWNSILLGYVKCGQGQKALKLYEQLNCEGIRPDHFTFVGVLSACASTIALEEGRTIHKQIIQTGCESNVFVSSSLIDMYAKCGSIEDAWTVFKQIPTHDVVCWNAMIHGHVRCGQGPKALDLFRQMQKEGVEAVAATFIAVLKACTSTGALEEGRFVHELIIQNGCELDVFVCCSLIDMYAKCRRIEDAWRVFNAISTHDAPAWNAMILGLVKCGEGQRAMELCQEMQREGMEPRPATFTCLLNACASLRRLDEGRRVHEQVIGLGYESDVFVGSSLVDMYMKCGSTEEAWRVFRQLPTRDLVCWNAMILGLVDCGQGQEALELFRQMQNELVEPGTVTFVGILKACATVGALDEGRLVHQQIVHSGCESDVFVGCSLVDMYAKCGSIEDASSVFNRMSTRDMVAWNAMITGYVTCAHPQKALELYQQMQREGVQPEQVIFVGVLKACSIVGVLEESRRVHEHIVQRQYDSDLVVCSRLVDMYVKCGSLEDAWGVFNKMPTHDVVSWNALILGLVKSGQGQKALELYEQMQQENVGPDPATYVALLDACTSIGAVEKGRHINEQITQSGWESDVLVASSLLEMYVKCGSIEDARRVFNEMPTRNVASLNAMLEGYTQQGHANTALDLFERLWREDVEVDNVSFVHLFSCCHHAGLVDEGLQYFKSMSSVYNVTPTEEHCACIFDLLGHAGRLDEAEDVIKKMRYEPSATMWISLLHACRVHGNVEVGQSVGQRILEVEPEFSFV